MKNRMDPRIAALQQPDRNEWNPAKNLRLGKAGASWNISIKIKRDADDLQQIDPQNNMMMLLWIWELHKTLNMFIFEGGRRMNFMCLIYGYGRF